MTIIRLLAESGVREGKWKVCALKFSLRHGSAKSSQAVSCSSVSNCHGSDTKTLMDRVDLRNPSVLETPGAAFSQ
jgi:hypothetical protein